jgi:hypothetical protein
LGLERVGDLVTSSPSFCLIPDHEKQGAATDGRNSLHETGDFTYEKKKARTRWHTFRAQISEAQTKKPFQKQQCLG